MFTSRRLASCMFAAALTSAAVHADLIYFNDFNTEAGGNWSVPSITTSLTGERYLGRFASNTVALSLDGIAPHSQVTVDFNLYIMMTMDGNSSMWGPDLLQLSVADGPTLLYTTFSNTAPQSYPDSYNPAAPIDNPAGTGAIGLNTLGNEAPYWVTTGSSVYHLSYTFDHTDSDLRLVFTGSNMQSTYDEYWGLDNFRVETSSVPEPGVFSTMALGLAGLVGLSAVRFRRKN